MTSIDAETPDGCRPAVSVPLLLPAALLALALFKAAVMARRIGPDWGLAAFAILRPDLLTIAIILLLLLASGSCRSRPLRFAGGAMALGLSICQLIDTQVILLLNDRLHAEDFLKFAPDVRLMVSMIRGPKVIAVLVFLWLAWRHPLRCTPARLKCLLILGLLCLAASAVPIHEPKATERYAHSIFAAFAEPFDPASLARYPEDIARAAVEPFVNRSRATPIPGHPNLILVLVESFSAAYSQRTSQIQDLAPQFDQLSKEGVLFDNFFANDSNSEGALVSILSGSVPLAIIGGTSLIHREYSVQPSVVPELQSAGYNFEFLASTPADFLSKSSYLRAIGFSTVRGRDDVPRFHDAPRFGFESPADGILYDEALDRVASLEGTGHPFTLVIVTGSSHRPYIDPLGREPTPENMYSYVGTELRRLDTELRKQGFYENGILLVSGDHHDMYPVEQREIDRYGDSAASRVPLLLIGKEVPAGGIDHRPWQQSELFLKLPLALSPETALASNLFHVRRGGGGIHTIAMQLEVFDPASDLRHASVLGIEGTKLSWLTPPPAAGERVVDDVHEQRKAAQEIRRTRLTDCSFAVPQLGVPSSAHGVTVEYFRGDLANTDPWVLRGAAIGKTELPSIDAEAVFNGSPAKHFTAQITGYLDIPTAGTYFLNIFANEGMCLAVDGSFVVDAIGAETPRYLDGSMALSAGLHPFVLRYTYQGRYKPALQIGWFPPGTPASSGSYPPIPSELLIRAGN